MASPDPRPSWDEYFFGLSYAAQARADCTRRKAGAVIVDTHHRVIGVGYNGAASGIRGCLSDGACPRGQLSDDQLAAYSDYDSGPGRCIAVHAEANAIFNAAGSVRGAILYTTSDRPVARPCQGCWRSMGGAGISEVHWHEDGVHWVGYPSRDPFVWGFAPD